ncbi:MAG TPA: hypothetical protein VGS41_14875, partial [Chthonomonadales bacterium]|nr:hypothetical protein [Chthonomonadales bacterium]
APLRRCESSTLLPVINFCAEPVSVAIKVPIELPGSQNGSLQDLITGTQLKGSRSLLQAEAPHGSPTGNAGILLLNLELDGYQACLLSV